MPGDSWQRGFTLVELMIGLVISSIVMIGVINVFRSQQAIYVVGEEIVVMQQNLRAAINQMARELRMATYCPATNSPLCGITTAQAGTITFTNEIDNVGTLQTIQYSLYDAYADGDNDIGRQVDAAVVPTALAENIEAIEFVYLDEDGNVWGPPLALKDIATIQLSVLARADQPDQNFVNTFDYFPASCPPPLAPALRDTCVAGMAWDFDGAVDGRNRFNDNLRRRLLTTTINLRN